MMTYPTRLLSGWLIFILMSLSAVAEPYRMIAGGSVLGSRENEKENVTLGFNAAFNSMLAEDDIQCDFKIYENSDELFNAIARNEINSFFGSPVEFFKSESSFLKKPLVSALFGDELKARSIIVVRTDSGIDSLKQLKGKKISAHNLIINDVTGLYLETLLLERGFPPMERFFSEIILSETSNRAFVDLFFKKVDATILSETQYNIASDLNPQLRKQTKIIESSEPYLMFVAALAKGTPDDVANHVKNHLVNIQKTPKGRHVLDLMKMRSFVEVSDADLDNLRALIEKNKRLKGTQNAK